MVKVGDRVPDVEGLQEKSPGNAVNLAKELSGKGIIIGVPAAFSPSCSNSHIPGFIKHEKLQNAGQVFVISVNDAFVMKAWADSLDAGDKSGIRYLADPSGSFTEALDMAFVNKPVFGGTRSKRYAIVVDDGKVKSVHVEPDNTGVSVSTAENVLGKL